MSEPSYWRRIRGGRVVERCGDFFSHGRVMALAKMSPASPGEVAKYKRDAPQHQRMLDSARRAGEQARKVGAV